MITLFFLVCIILIIIQIYSVVKLKRTIDSKYWNRFIGITFASFISTIISYITFLIDDTLDLDKAVFSILFCCLLLISNIVLLIVGLIIKKNLKSEKVKLNIRSIFISLIVIVVMVLILIVIPTINNKYRISSVYNNVISYLNHKYGDNSFKIVNIRNSYSYDGFGRRHAGYELTVSSSVLEDNFTVTTGGTRIGTNFINKYYNEITNEYLSQKYDSEINILIVEKDDNISYNLGHIPTFNELIDCNEKMDIYIGVNLKRIYDYYENERIEYIKNLLFDLIDFLNISRNINNIKIDFKNYSDYYNSYLYDSQILNNNLIIINRNGSVYEFNISDLKEK